MLNFEFRGIIKYLSYFFAGAAANSSFLFGYRAYAYLKYTLITGPELFV